MKELKPLDYRILSELMKNAKSSDRQLAKKLGVSQPTITRRRTRLEKEIALSYTTIPDWSKLGFQIVAITFGQWKHKIFSDEMMSEAMEFLSRHPNIVFMSSGRGVGSDRVGISLHKDYRDYQRFMQDVRQTWGTYVDSLASFIISIGGDTILRPITLKYLADYIGEEGKKKS
ncbi:MAG: Lrp/AsnC family transcriptional regulator [Candidatus Bathyarchaeota archaeon]|nr:MAG: Lrp/AsnC family transcriptional regulator [Candidatus Bathyarchaeota archaeon]